MFKSPESHTGICSDIQSTNRLRQHQDWAHPMSIQILDQGPNLSDRYSETSSPQAVGSFTTTGQQNFTNPKKSEQVIQDSKIKNSQYKSPKNHLELSDLGSQEASSSLVGSKSQGQRDSFKLQSGSNNYPKKKSKLSQLTNSVIKRQEQILYTKKLIKKNLKQEIVLPQKAKSLQSIFKKLHSFIKVARVFTRSHSISSEQHRLIRDLSSHKLDSKQFKKIKLISWFNFKVLFWSILDFITSLGGLNKCFFKNKIILLPTDQLNVYWMMFQFIFNSFALYYASIYIVFDFRNRLLEIDLGKTTASGIYTTNVFVLIFTTILDILKGFNTAYYKKGETVLDRKEVAINYLKGRFIFDLLSLFSVIFSKTFFPKMNLLLMYRVQFLFLFKIHNIQHVIEVFKSTFIMNEKYDNIISLLRLLCILCLTSHAMAICYHVLLLDFKQKLYFLTQIINKYQGEAQLQIYFMDSTATWLHQANIVDEGYWVRYINSFFCSAGTLVNAIIYNPQTTIETVFMTACLLINCCIFGYVINELGNIMDNIERNSKTSKKELRLINSYLQNKHVNRELQTRIRNYLDYMHREEKQLNLEETKIVISKLSNQLKNELIKEVNSQYIENFHILSKIFSKKTQDNSLFIMQDHKYTPGEIIFKEGEQDDYSIYMIWEGQIDIYHTNQRDEDYLIQTLTKGSCFGEISFFTGLNRTASARSSEFTSLIKIEREQFIHLIKEHSQEDYELFQQINHQIQQSQDYSLLYEKETKQGKCYTCGSTNHIAKRCTLTHFQPLPVAVVQTASRSFYQDRMQQKRKDNMKWHAREHNNLLKQEAAIQKIEEEYESRIEELVENILELSDYEMEQSEQQPHGLQRQQTYQERQAFFDRQNTGGQYNMLASNQDHNDTIGFGRVDYKNMSINIPNNPYMQGHHNQKETNMNNTESYPFKDSKEMKDQQRRSDSQQNININTNFNGFNKDQAPRRGSKLYNYNNTTLTQIQEIISPPQQHPVLVGNPSQYFGQQQQQQQFNFVNPLQLGNLQLNSHNNSFLTNLQSPMQAISPKNIQQYHGIRKNVRKDTHQSTNQYNKRQLGKHDSHDIHIPRTATNQGLNHQQVHGEHNHHNNAISTKMKESYANLIEQYGGSVSLHIDFMRNYKKYFPNFNISTIETTHIGKKSMQNSSDSMKKAGNSGSGIPKKVATVKRATTSKNKTKIRKTTVDAQSSVYVK